MASIGNVTMLRLAGTHALAITVKTKGQRAYAFRLWLGTGLLRMVARLLGMQLYIAANQGDFFE